MLCTTPHHTTQTVALNRKVHAASISLICDILNGGEFLFYTMSASEDRYLRIRNQLITAQP